MTDENSRGRRPVSTPDDLDETFGLAPVPSNYKVRGQIDNPDAAGVFGHNTAATGTAQGVRGRVQSPTNDAVGVFGDATAATGGAYGVRGETRSYEGGAGVEGRALSSTFRGYADGVSGITDAWGVTFGVRNPAAGVRGRATNATGTTSGVLGENPSGDAGNSGIEGHAESLSGRVYGARGRTSSEHPDTAGVYGVARANSTQGYGVHGELLYSTDDDAAAVTGTAPHPAAALNAEGWVDVDNVGAVAYVTGGQTISSTSYQQVEFDATEMNHRTQFDTTTHEYTVPRDGDYFVDANVEFATRFTEGTDYGLAIDVDGGLEARTFREVPTTSGSSTPESQNCIQVTKLLPGLTAGQSISVEAYQNSGSSKDLRSAVGSFPDRALNYLSVAKIG